MHHEMKCCMPGCIWTSIMKHTSIHRIKPQWKPLIHAYIRKVRPIFETCPRLLLSHMICTRHIRSCGIRDKPLEGPVHFPFLKISVSRQPQRDRLRHRIYSSEEIVVGREETIPVVKVIINSTIDSTEAFIKQKKIFTHIDHTYAASASMLRLCQDEVARLGIENTALKNQIVHMTTEFEKELQRLDKVTHQLVEKNIKYITSGIEYPFKSIPENEQMLEFYTGFSNRQCFFNFLAFIRPKYVQGKNDTLGIVNQLVLFLSRLRLGLMLEDLAYRFNISVNLVVRTWLFWLNLMNDVLVKESPNLDTKSSNPGSNCEMVVECCETFFELKTHAKTRKLYGRVRSVLEFTADGCVFHVSDLFTAQTNTTQLVDSTQVLNCIEGDMETAKTLQDHVQKMLQFVKGSQIMKGAFPNATCDIDEINTFWKICCFLMNFSHPRLSAKYIL